MFPPLIKILLVLVDLLVTTMSILNFTHLFVLSSHRLINLFFSRVILA